MKPIKLRSIYLLAAGTCFLFLLACGSGNNRQGKDSAYRESDSPKQKQGQQANGPDYKTPDFKTDQLIIYFKKRPNATEITSIKLRIAEYTGKDTLSINVKSCVDCTTEVQLWQGPDVHTFVHAESVKGGASTGNGTKNVGEDSLAYYTQNYTMNIPPEQPLPAAVKRKAFAIQGKRRDTVIVALLDTGVDTTLGNFSQYLWKNPMDYSSNGKDEDGNCLQDDVHGWNFVADNADIQDHNTSAHGTLVSHFIINEFIPAGKNALQLMVLKTHDRDNNGNLFDIICALYYAKAHHANVINASWGFYSNYDMPSPYYPLDSLITQSLDSSGILFIAAAGNKIAAEDEKARLGGVKTDSMRRLDSHHFYPACLGGKENNVLVVTTTSDTAVSPTQNYSGKYVDLGVLAAKEENGYLKFRLPFSLTPEFVTGSSFATAIATGKIAAICRPALYRKGLHKSQFLDAIAPIVKKSGKIKAKGQIREGWYIIPR